MKTKENKNHLIVECIVSGRFLKIEKESAKFPDGEYIIIDVMSYDYEENSKKLVQLIVIKEKLIAALNKITPKDP